MGWATFHSHLLSHAFDSNKYKRSFILFRNFPQLKKEIERIQVGLLLGDRKPFTKYKVKLKKNDMLYIYSDGYQDQFGGEKGKKYMAAKFKKQLLKMSNESTDEQITILEKEFKSWSQNYEQIDDVCVMGVRII